VCMIHERRPPNCRIFPVDRRDLSDRDQIAPDRPCGFSFQRDSGSGGSRYPTDGAGEGFLPD
jgi:hypothetical protein